MKTLGEANAIFPINIYRIFESRNIAFNIFMLLLSYIINHITIFLLLICSSNFFDNIKYINTFILDSFFFFLIIFWTVLTLHLICIYTFIYFNLERVLFAPFFFLVTLQSIQSSLVQSDLPGSIPST